MLRSPPTALEYRRCALEEYNIDKLAPELEVLARNIDRARGEMAKTVREKSRTVPFCLGKFCNRFLQ